MQKCVLGRGFSVEKVNEKCLITRNFESCEGNLASYAEMTRDMEKSVQMAIEAVEGVDYTLP